MSEPSVKRLLRGATLLACLAGASQAFAHAHLQSAQPAADSTTPAPTELRLTFSEGVEAAFSKVEIKSADGQAVSTAAPATSAGDKKVLVITPTGALAPGKYQVNWQVVSVDTHKSEGTYSFEVGK